MLDGVLAAAVAGLAPAMGAIFVSDPDRPGLQLVASHGMDQRRDGRLSTAVNDPADPFTTAAVTRIATFDREATAADGSGFVGAYLPLVVGSGGVDTVLGAIGFGWPAPRALDATEQRDADRAGRAGRAGRSTGRAWPRRPPSAPNGSSGWPTPTR